VSELSDLLDKEKIKAYIGFDCTAQSLHVGSLLQIMCLRLLQKDGHQPIVLLGGGTTRIGDPSGKDKTRKILNEEEIEKNIENIQNILKKFLDNNDPNTKPIFVNNYTWLKNLNYISFLRDIGKHFTINKMLTFDSVKTRLEREQSLSYMEFNYMILQAYDFLELNKNQNCVLQIGGSDQWGNIVNGVELIKRYSNKQSYGLTTPLITLANGAKMGKSENGAIWLDKKLLSAYEYWQFWRNTDDRDVVKFLKIFTDIKNDKIEKEKDNDINKLKILLANEATAMLHDKEAAENSEQAAKEVFSGNSLGSNLLSIKIQAKDLNRDINILDLVILSKLETSKSEIRRLLKGNAIKINDEIISDEKLIIEDKFFNDNYLKLSIGKKRHIKIEID
jgi:tyrosyl-tRNA synthetase